MPADIITLTSNRRSEEPTPSGSKSRRAKAEPKLSSIFAAPALIVYTVFFLIPTLAGVGYSFTNWNGLNSPEFVGLSNYKHVVNQTDGRGAIVHTLLIAGVFVVLVNAVGLALALGLNRTLKTRSVLRALFFAPAMLSPLGVAYIWQFILQPTGPLNGSLKDIGLGSFAQPWLGQGYTALLAIIVVMVWQYSGYTMVIYLAGLQSISQELYEAAAIDGAHAGRQFLDITRPQLVPALSINLTLMLITGLKVFDQIVALTSGGPGNATETVATQVYNQAFVYGRFGYSAALGVVMTIGIALFAALQLRLVHRKRKA